jgi:hypothetical protein
MTVLCRIEPGLMLIPVALGVMNLAWTAVITVVVTAQKLLPARTAVDVAQALLIGVLGMLILVAPSAVPGLAPSMTWQADVAMTGHKIGTREERLGWSFPWASSAGSDVNYDFRVAFSEQESGSPAPVARPRAPRPQRERLLVASPRRVRQRRLSRR